MKNNTTPWSYRKGHSPLHRLQAGIKLVFLFLLSLAVFFPGTETGTVIILSCAAIILGILSIIAGILPWKLLRGSGPLLLLVFAVFVLQGIQFSPIGFNTKGLRESAIFCIRIGTAFAAGSLLFAITTTGEIRKSISRFESAVHLERFKIGISLALMLGFLKQFFEVWEDINSAWKSRGGKNNLKRLIILIPLVIERMMIKAMETASAMESRGI
ncbi:MAG: CbiQ family ECF transporter T component [Treponema sp.]|nr:CbiQ family ECF transporter T component [Treponema sp.]